MSQPNTQLAKELNRVIVAEFNRAIANLRARGKEKDADRLERYKQVFFVEPTGNFDVDRTLKEQTIYYEKEK